MVAELEMYKLDCSQGLSRIRVCVPLGRESHPYLQLLYSRIEKYGFEVLHSDGSWNFDFLKKVCVTHILHLHWIEYLIKSQNYLLVFVKFLAFLLILFFIKIKGKFIIVTLHNLYPHEVWCPKLENLWFKVVLKFADRIIVHNQYSRGILEKLYGITDKVCVVPHGNFIDYYPNRMDQRIARKILRVSDDVFVVLYFGAIRDYKGVDELLAVLRDLLPKYDVLFPIICGKIQGERLHKELVRFSNDFKGKCIIRLEYVPDEEIQVYMNAADVGILPYKEITTSGAVLLFQSFARTVIVPDLPPIREVMGGNGLYFRPGDKEDMKTSIIRALCMGREQMRLLGSKAYENALKLDWNYIGRLTSEVYISLMSTIKC